MAASDRIQLALQLPTIHHSIKTQVLTIDHVKFQTYYLDSTITIFDIGLFRANGPNNTEGSSCEKTVL